MTDFALSPLDLAIIGASIGFSVAVGFWASRRVEKTTRGFFLASGKMPWLGVEERQLRPAEAKKLGLPEGQGNLVVGVVPNGPAAGAGIKAGDVITKVGTQAIKGTSELRSVVRSHNVGETLDITVIRNGKEMVLPVKIGAVPQNLGGSP